MEGETFNWNNLSDNLNAHKSSIQPALIALVEESLEGFTTIRCLMK